MSEADSSSANAVAWLKTQAQPVRRWLTAAMAAGAAGTVLLCVQAGLLAWALNAVIIEHRPWRVLWPALLVYVVLAALRFGLSVLGRRCGFAAGAGVVTTVRARLLAHLQRLGPVWLGRQSTGELMTRVVDGVDALGPYYARYLPQKAAAVLLPLVILAVVLPADWVAGLVLLVSAPLVPIFMILLGGVAERASQRRWVTLTRLGTQFFDALQGLVTLRLFGAGARRRAVLAERSEAYRRETMAVLRVAFLSSLVLEFFAMVSIAVVAVLVGFRLMWGDLHFVRGMFVLLLAPEFFLPLRALGALRHARMDALSIAVDVSDSLAIEVPTASSGGRRVDGAITVELDQLGFEHEPGRPVLDGVSARFDAGSMTAVVGPSGAGKSSLLMLLMGFLQPKRGVIRINGVDLAELDVDAWRRCIAWVPQRPHLFVGTVRDNVRLARQDADDASLQAAAAAAGLDTVIAALPAGWDTPLGENGHGLSGGQAQRLALARAFLRDAPLLLLDEPTQHLDSDSAAAVTAAIERLRQGRTVVQVAHRLASARAADRVLVLRAGRVVETGAPEQLANADGLFGELVRAEAGA